MFPAQRFESFSKSENLGVAALANITTSDVYNTVSNKLSEATEGLTSLVDSLKESIIPPDFQIDNKLQDATRAVKDVFSTLQDVTKMAPKMLENQIASMLPDNPVIQNTFRQLASQCKNKALSQRPGFKKFKDKIGCGKSKSGCSGGEVSGLLGKVTGGLIDAIGKTLDMLMTAVMTLANLGYNAGLCKIFASLVNNIPGGVIQKAAAGVMAMVGGQGNVSAVFDIASGMGNAIPSLEIPSLVGRVTENFKAPAAFIGKGAQLFDGAMDAFHSIEPGFDKDAFGMKSISALGSKFNSDFGDAASSFLSSDFNIGNMNSVIRRENDSLASAYIGAGSGVSYNDDIEGFFSL